MRNTKLAWVLLILFSAVMCIGGCSKDNSGGSGAVQDTGSEDSSSLVGKSMDAGKAAECRSQLSQIRQAIEVYRVGNDTNPSSFADLGLPVGEDFFRCPVSGESYLYDPGDGVVKCPTTGHTNY